MKLDLLYEIQVPKPWPAGQRAAEQRSFYEALEQINLADQVGFNTVWMVEHHFREGRSHCSAPEVILGALSQTTRNLRLGFGVTLMPHGFGHPTRVAEKVATADILSHGRVEWGTGRSTPLEQVGFGVPTDGRSKVQWREAVKTVVDMWDSDRFSSDTEFLTMPSRAVLPKPYQQPHPPCWLAAVSDESAVNAGRAGVGLLSFSIFRSLEKMGQQIQLYRDAIRTPEPITRVVNNRVAAYTLVHCRDDEAQAKSRDVWQSVWWWYKDLAEFTLEWEAAHFTQEEKDKHFPYLRKNRDGGFDPQEFDSEDMIIIGTPEQCLRKIRRYQELGVDQLICYVQFGRIPHAAIMECIRTLGTQVIPRLEGTATLVATST